VEGALKSTGTPGWWRPGQAITDIEPGTGGTALGTFGPGSEVYPGSSPLTSNSPSSWGTYFESIYGPGNVVRGGGTALADAEAAAVASNAIPGLSYRTNLATHLVDEGPNAFSNSKGLFGTHNMLAAETAITKAGGDFEMLPTGTPGLYEMDYVWQKPSGALKESTKTVYDPAVWPDKTMIEMSQLAGADSFKRYIQNPGAYPGTFSSLPIDTSIGGVNFRTYIQLQKVDPLNPLTWYPYVGNVHPIK
jgi:hypothetical protein